MIRTLTIATCLSCLLPACAESDGPEYRDPELAFAIAVQQHLAPGTVKVKLFEPMAPSNSGDAMMQLVPVAAGTAESGALLVHVALSAELQQAYEALFSVGPTGIVERLGRPPAAPVFDGTVKNLSLPGGVVVHCGGKATAFRLASAGLELVPEPAGACSGTSVYGTSSAQGYLAGAKLSASALDFFAHRVDDGSVARPVSVAGQVGKVVYVEEAPEGVYLALLRNGFDHVVVRSDGTTRSAALPEAGGNVYAAQRTPEGIVQFLDSGQAVLWDLDDATSSPLLVPPPPLPSDVPAGMWALGGNFGNGVAVSATVNPKYDKAHVPVAAQTRRWNAGGFSLSDVPTTPCTARSACRKYGESYLLAELDASTHRAGLYAFWAWTSQLAFFVSPLEREEQP